MAIRSHIFSHFEEFEETSTPTIFRAQCKYCEQVVQFFSQVNLAYCIQLRTGDTALS